MRVSIAIPIYGVEKYIERCARSVFEQTYEDIEYIFVNDCTPDKSIQILEEVIKDYPQREKNVKIIHNEKNCGLAVTRFVGINHCTSDFVYNIDSDDYLEENTIQILVDKQQVTDADIVSSHIIINENHIDPNFKHPDYKSPKDMLEDILSQSLHHELCGRLIRKELFLHSDINAVEGHNVGEDWLVTPKLVYYSNKIALVDKYLYHYNRDNEKSYMSVTKKENLFVANIDTLFLLKYYFVSYCEFHFNNLISNYICSLISKGLYDGLEKMNKEKYEKMLSYCKMLEDDYTSKIWGYSFKKVVMQNYYSSIVLYNAKKIFYHLLKA